MKITETITRECCQSQDLLPYKGDMKTIFQPFKPCFCKHCGQIWLNDKEMGPAGSMEPVLRKYTLKEDY